MATRKVDELGNFISKFSQKNLSVKEYSYLISKLREYFAKDPSVVHMNTDLLQEAYYYIATGNKDRGKTDHDISLFRYERFIRRYLNV